MAQEACFTANQPTSNLVDKNTRHAQFTAQRKMLCSTLSRECFENPYTKSLAEYKTDVISERQSNFSFAAPQKIYNIYVNLM